MQRTDYSVHDEYTVHFLPWAAHLWQSPSVPYALGQLGQHLLALGHAAVRDRSPLLDGALRLLRRLLRSEQRPSAPQRMRRTMVDGRRAEGKR